MVLAMFIFFWRIQRRRCCFLFFQLRGCLSSLAHAPFFHLKIHYSSHLFAFPYFLLALTLLPLLYILTFALAHPDNSSILRSLIYSYPPNPSVKCGNIHTNSETDVDILGKAVILSTSVFLLAPKELCLSHVQHASYEVSDHYLIHLKLKFHFISSTFESPKSNWEIFIMIQGLGRIMQGLLGSSLEDQSSGSLYCPLGAWSSSSETFWFLLEGENVCNRETVSYCLLFTKESISKIPWIWGAQWPLFILSFSVPSVRAGSTSACMLRPLRTLWISHEGYGVWLSDKIIHGSLVDNPASISGFCRDNWEIHETHANYLFKELSVRLNTQTIILSNH